MVKNLPNEFLIYLANQDGIKNVIEDLDRVAHKKND